MIDLLRHGYLCFGCWFGVGSWGEGGGFLTCGIVCGMRVVGLLVLGFGGVVVCYLGAVVTCCLWFGGVGLCNCLVVDFCLVFWVYLRARC